MSRWGDTSSDEEHHHHHRHNDEENKEATPETVEAVSTLVLRYLRYLGVTAGICVCWI